MGKRKKDKRIMGFLWFGLAIVLLGVLFWGGTHGWFTPVYNSVVNQVSGGGNLPSGSSGAGVDSYSLVISFSAYEVCPGDKFMAYVDSNLPEGSGCGVYVDKGSGWLFLNNFVLGSGGDYSEQVSVSESGVADFRVVCKVGDVVKLSNVITLLADECGLNPGESVPEPAVDTCVDSDGGQDDQHYIYGTCESSVTQSGTYDFCSSGKVLMEQYCDSDFICKSLAWECTDGQVCINGACRQPRCADIINPNGQMDCDVGYCSGGLGCVFNPPHMGIPGADYLCLDADSNFNCNIDDTVLWFGVF